MVERIVHLGMVAVDSGNLMIVDPCYVVGGYDWFDFIDRHLQSAVDNEHQGGEFEAAGFANGVLFKSGLGDGWYQVRAFIADIPGWGSRIKKVEIILIEDEEDDDSNEDV